MANTQDIATFAAQLALEKPFVDNENHHPAPAFHIGLDVRRMMLLARVIHKHAENQCNRETTPREDAKAARAMQNLRSAATLYGAVPDFSGDPRDAVKLILKSGKTNDFGRTGFCIPD